MAHIYEPYPAKAVTTATGKCKCQCGEHSEWTIYDYQPRRIYQFVCPKCSFKTVASHTERDGWIEEKRKAEETIRMISLTVPDTKDVMGLVEQARNARLENEHLRQLEREEEKRRRALQDEIRRHKERIERIEYSEALKARRKSMLERKHLERKPVFYFNPFRHRLPRKHYFWKNRIPQIVIFLRYFTCVILHLEKLSKWIEWKESLDSPRPIKRFWAGGINDEKEAVSWAAGISAGVKEIFSEAAKMRGRLNPFVHLQIQEGNRV